MKKPKKSGKVPEFKADPVNGGRRPKPGAKPKPAPRKKPMC